MNLEWWINSDTRHTAGEDIKPTEWNHPLSIGLLVLAMACIFGCAFVPKKNLSLAFMILLAGFGCMVASYYFTEWRKQRMLAASKEVTVPAQIRFHKKEQTRYGYRLRYYRDKLLITFRTDTNEALTFEVDERTYYRTDDRLTGQLTYCAWQFRQFVPDEPQKEASA